MEAELRVNEKGVRIAPSPVRPYHSPCRKEEDGKKQQGGEGKGRVWSTSDFTFKRLILKGLGASTWKARIG